MLTTRVCSRRTEGGRKADSCTYRQTLVLQNLLGLSENTCHLVVNLMSMTQQVNWNRCLGWRVTSIQRFNVKVSDQFISSRKYSRLCEKDVSIRADIKNQLSACRYQTATSQLYTIVTTLHRCHKTTPLSQIYTTAMTPHNRHKSCTVVTS